MHHFATAILIWLFSTGALLAKEFTRNTITLDQIDIQGSSNFSNFSLGYSNNESLKPTETADSIITFHIPVKHITASNQLMLNDFRQLIHSDQYSFINISITKSQIQLVMQNNPVTALAVNIGISGTNNSYLIPFVTGYLPNHDKYITGTARLYLSDFNLQPHSKFFGLIKLNDEVFINFRIKL